MYWWGDLERDEGKAVSYFKVAAKKGDRNAQHALGFAYQYGRGVKTNLSKALKLYRLAAEQGHAEAQNRLGNAYRDGEGVTKDTDEAFKWC